MRNSPQAVKVSIFSLFIVIIMLLTSSYSGLPAPAEEAVYGIPPPSCDDSIQMMPEVPEPQDHSAFLDSTGISSRNIGLMYLLVEPGLYPGITEEIDRYISDVEAEGYTVELHTEGWTNETAVRALLQSGYGQGMVGAFLVGDIPAPRYEIENDFNEYGYTDFPVDLYYMDLDGNWIDSDFNGRYDEHTAGSGDIEADIWVGRIYASSITIPGQDEISLTANYFHKNHEYRMGNLSLYDRALVYIDDDWADFPSYYDRPVGRRYPDRTFVNDTEETVAPDYLERIITNYTAHLFEVENETIYGPSTGGELAFAYLAHEDITNCSVYVDCDGMGFEMLSETSDYILNRSTGWIDFSPSGPLESGCTFYAYYNYTIYELTDDTPFPVINETVYGPSAGGETAPIWLANDHIADCQLFLDVDDEWVYLEEGLEYYLDRDTGMIDISPIAPMEPNWTFHGFYNYSRTLAGYYDWVSLFAHSAWYYHSFKYNNQTQWSSILNSEISSEETMAHFYNLFCCSAGEFTKTSSGGCLAGHYVLSGTHSLCAIASSKTGSMLNFEDFYSPLGLGAGIGDSFLQWFQLNAESGAGSQFDSRCWFYGMTIFGDPTLDTFDDVRPQPPTDVKLNFSGTDVIVSWAPSSSPDIHHYEVYSAQKPDDFDFSSPVYSTMEARFPRSNSYLDKDACLSGSSRYYIVRAFDYAMNSDNNTNIAGMFRRAVTPGNWTLVSMPLLPYSNNLSLVMNGTDYDIIKYYDSSGDWLTNSDSRPASFNDLLSLDGTMGFWMKSSSDMLTLGNLPGTSTINLQAGWNLVGYPSLNTSVMIQDVLWGTGADRVEIYDPTAPYLLQEAAPTYVMQPGEGYWIHVPADSVWIVDW